MNTVAYLTIQRGMPLVVTSRVPEAKLLIIRASDRMKGVSKPPSIFAQTFKSNVLN
jgi:hypothetical protein